MTNGKLLRLFTEAEPGTKPYAPVSRRTADSANKAAERVDTGLDISPPINQLAPVSLRVGVTCIQTLLPTLSLKA